MTQETQDRKFEIKTIKEVKYLPNVFQLRHQNGQISTITTSYGDFIDCRPKEDKFFGCLELRDYELKRTKNVYYVPGIPIFYITFEKSLFQSKKHVEPIVTTILTNFGLIDRNLLITYTGHEIQMYSRFHKAQLHEFPLIHVHKNLEFYEVPKADPKVEYDFEDTDTITIYDYEIKFPDIVMVSELYSEPGKAYLVYPENNMEIIVTSSKNEGFTIMLHKDKYYLITHPEIEEENEGEMNGNS